MRTRIERMFGLKVALKNTKAVYYVDDAFQLLYCIEVDGARRFYHACVVTCMCLFPESSSMRSACLPQSSQF